MVFQLLRDFLLMSVLVRLLSIAGIDGNGQTELIQAITGLRKAGSGEITIRTSLLLVSRGR